MVRKSDVVSCDGKECGFGERCRVHRDSCTCRAAVSEEKQNSFDRGWKAESEVLESQYKS